MASLQEHVFLPPGQATFAHLQLAFYGVQMIFNGDMAVAVARAINRFIAAEWLAATRAARLDRDPIQSVEKSVEENRILGGRQALRAGCWCVDGRDAAWSGATTGRSG